MPLSFESKNYGEIAFGFFNIESDILLLENYFFFLDDFCNLINQLADFVNEDLSDISFDICTINDREQIGDLMGAIHKIRFTGFIGELYKKFPFPEDQKKFKQNPKCFETRKDVELLLKKYAKTQSIVFKIDKKTGEVLIGEYKFTKNVFYELILYVWQGGLPRWKDNIQPANVVEMKEKILASSNSLFDNIRFD